MNFTTRFFYFSFGLVFGSVILLFSFQLRKEPIKFNYLPSSRVISHISNHDIIFSENISCKVDCISLDIESLRTYISESKVNFKKSEIHKAQRKVYILSHKDYQFKFQEFGEYYELSELEIKKNKCINCNQ